MLTDNLIDSAARRAAWIATAHMLISACLRLETDISIAMTAYPTSRHALELLSADVQLGQAVAALGEAAVRIGRLAQ